jgi:hypothetical protein
VEAAVLIEVAQKKILPSNPSSVGRGL